MTCEDSLNPVLHQTAKCSQLLQTMLYPSLPNSPAPRQETRSAGKFFGFYFNAYTLREHGWFFKSYLILGSLPAFMPEASTYFFLS